MPALNIFENDAFGVASLTKAINDVPYVPGRLGALGLFQEEGMVTTSAMIEISGETLSLISAGQRGNAAAPVTSNKRSMVSVNAIHLPQRGSILADAIQNVRAFGSETELQTVQTMVVNFLAKMRRRIDATIEYHRMGALRGQILDADGTSVLVDLLSVFGLEKSTLVMGLTSDATDVLAKVLAAKRLGEDKLGNTFATGWRVLCSASFFDAFTGHAKVTDAFQFYNAQVKSKDMRSGFDFGDVIWEEYRGKVGGVSFIPDGKALMVPEGVPDFLITNYAPADYMETVNTIGLPYYAKQELLKFNKGVDLETQSNPICYCTRPTAIIELSIS
jgi:hypothetical protein